MNREGTFERFFYLQRDTILRAKRFFFFHLPDSLILYIESRVDVQFVATLSIFSP